VGEGIGVIVGMIVGVGVGVGVGVAAGVGVGVGATVGLGVAETRGRGDRVAAAADCCGELGLAEAGEVGLGLSEAPEATVGAYVDDAWDGAGAGA
jgi:hypothetical protein